MFTQFITLTTTVDDKIRVVAIPVNNIALMEEYAMGTIITPINGDSFIVNESIEQILSKIEEDDDVDEEEWDDDDE